MEEPRTPRDRVSKVVRYRAQPDLDPRLATARISAFVYGNVLVFAAAVALTEEDAHHWHGVLAVLGVAASTYLAHVFAELVGHGVGSAGHGDPEGLVTELRDAFPIISSAFVPALLLSASALHWLDGRTALFLAEVSLLVRMALVGFLVERLRSERPSFRTLLAGFGLAAMAALISLLKVFLTH